VGAENAKRAVEKIAKEHGTEGILVLCGFCGGLGEAVTVGSLVIVESVCEPASPNAELLADAELEAVLTALHPTEIPCFRGKMVSTPSVLTTPAEKAECARKTGAIAVDMETYAAAREAEAHGLRWIGVRAVTDGAKDTLPLDFNAFNDANGNPDRGKIVLATLARPHKIPALIRLGSRSAQAAKNLALYLDLLLNHLPKP
jgi:adenosylhomocysteine nucleosidase